MRIYTLDGTEVCDFTYDEELGLADSVMSVLENRGAFTAHSDIANDLYFAGTHGHVVRLSVLEQYLEATITLILRYEDYGKSHLAPVSFDPEDNGRYHKAPGETRTGDEINRSEWYTSEQIRAWREMWLTHRVALSAIDDSYRVFPGDTDGQNKENDRILTKFFREVIATMERYKMAYGQVLADVKDRCPNAGLDTDELTEVKDRYWSDAQRWYDKEQATKKSKMTPGMLRAKKLLAEYQKCRGVTVCDGGKDNKTAPVKSRLTDHEAKKAYEKELADYQSYLNGGK